MAKQSIGQQVAEIRRFNETAEGRARSLRLDVACIVWRRLVELDWTVERLAKQWGKPVDYMHGVFWAEHNLSVDEIGGLFWAVGLTNITLAVRQ